MALTLRYGATVQHTPTHHAIIFLEPRIATNYTLARLLFNSFYTNV